MTKATPPHSPNKIEAEITAGAPGRIMLTEMLGGSAPVHVPATDKIDYTGNPNQGVDCSRLRDPSNLPELRDGVKNAVDMVAPLPLPSDGVSTDVIRTLADERINLRGAMEDLTNRAIKACGPKAPGS